MQKIRLDILCLSVNQAQSGAYTLVLTEWDGERKIPVVIGPVEAQAIAIQMEVLPPPRPLTHDLIKNIATAFDIVLSEVTIYKIEEGIFYSELIFKMNGKEVRIDSRTSDAIALALRFNCPIYTFEDVFRKTGLVQGIENEGFYAGNFIDIDDLEEIKNSKYSIDKLREILNEAIQNEDYEKASAIRDELKKRDK